jgi:hypothetical protein
MLRNCWCRRRVAATSAGTNRLASIVPQPLATSKPLAALNPGTMTLRPEVTELLP